MFFITHSAQAQNQDSADGDAIITVLAAISLTWDTLRPINFSDSATGDPIPETIAPGVGASAEFTVVGDPSRPITVTLPASINM